MHKNIIMFDMDGTLLDLAYDDFIWNEQLPIRYAELHACSLERSKEILYDFYQAHSHTLEWYSSRFWTAKVGVDMLAMQLEYKDQVTLRPQAIELLEYLKNNVFLTVVCLHTYPHTVTCPQTYESFVRVRSVVHTQT